MAQAIFGSGILTATPLTDTTGSVVALPSPIAVGCLQDVSVDMSFETKQVHGSNSQFAQFIAKGKGSISVKAKMGTIQGEIFSSLFFGQSSTSGLAAIQYETIGHVVGLTAITPTVPRSGVYSGNMGVMYRNGVSLKRVASSPAVGQYAVNLSTGEYTFAAAEAGNVVLINFKYNADVTGAKKGTVVAQPMGISETLSLDLYTEFKNKPLCLTLHSVICTNLNLGFKSDEFTFPDLQFIAGQDDNGEVFSWSTGE